MKILIAVLIALALTACAHKPTPAEDTMKAGLMDGAIKTAQAPLFKLTCPPAGCILGSMEVGNPQGAAQMAEALRVVMTPQTTAGEKILMAVVDKGFGALGVGLVANGIKGVMGDMFKSQTAVATGGFEAMRGTAAQGFSVNGQIASFIPQPAANITTTTTSTIGGQGVIGSGQLTTTDRHDITTTTTDRHDVTNTNSQNTNPSPMVCTVSATGVRTCTGGG